jgi:hypothetical protein
MRRLRRRPKFAQCHLSEISKESLPMPVEPRPGEVAIEMVSLDVAQFCHQRL